MCQAVFAPYCQRMTITQETTRSPAAAPVRARNTQTKDFFELSKQVKDAGLLERGAQSYIGRAVALVVGFGVAGTLLAVVGQSPWQLAVAALFGVLFTQAAFLSHDSAHQQVFNTGKRNEWLSLLAGNAVVGLSYGWWTKKHGRHHAHPNTIGKDGDIRAGTLVFVPEDAAGRTGIAGWFARRQGWFFFPLLTLFGLSLHLTAVDALIRGKKVKYRKMEAVLLGIRLIGFPAVVFFLLGPWLGLGFMAVQLAVFGVYMGASFAPNHKGMPLIPKDADVDFLRRQVLTSRNVRGGRVLDWAMGGLNYQVEHHLFPRMPSPKLHKVQPIVRAFCAERGVPYTEAGVLESQRLVIQYLNRVGLGQADPMDCPIIAQYRPR